MFTRNQLAHLVIWPVSTASKIELVDPNGEPVAAIPCNTAVRGSDLARMLPADFSLACTKCTIVTMSGEIKVRTVGEFDTAIVTERTKPSIEERFARLERRERRREQRERDAAEANRKLAEENRKLKEAENDDFEVVEKDVPETPKNDTDEGGNQTGETKADTDTKSDG